MSPEFCDRETGYYYNYFRTYDPLSGRYLESDPIGLHGGWNTYGYVGGKPVMRVDPEGLIAAKPFPADPLARECANECEIEFFTYITLGAIGAAPIPKKPVGIPMVGKNPSPVTNPISYVGFKLQKGKSARIKTRVLGTTRVAGILGRAYVGIFFPAWILYQGGTLGECVNNCRSLACGNSAG